MEINWTAIAAIGTCLGALATFVAVRMSLRQSRTRLSATLTFDGVPAVVVVNAGVIPAPIEYLSVRYMRSGKRKEFSVLGMASFPAGFPVVSVGEVVNLQPIMSTLYSQDSSTSLFGKLRELIWGPLKIYIVEPSGKRHRVTIGWEKRTYLAEQDAMSSESI